MSFEIPNIDQEIQTCVFKLYYGDRYLVAKGKTLAGSIFLIEKGYAHFLAGGGGTGTKLKGDGQTLMNTKNTLYWKFYEYIKKHPGLDFKIEVVLESEDGYELLITEQSELDKGIKDKKNLNNNVEAYVPKYRNTTESYGWLSVADVERFHTKLKSL